jgi:hypothetical protein
MAPSMTTPAATYFQSATSNFRASATMVAFFPPFAYVTTLKYCACDPEIYDLLLS